MKGRKRHLLVVIFRFLLQLYEANIQDYHGGKLLMAPLGGCFPRLEMILADSGYKKVVFCEWVYATLGWKVEIVEHPWSGIHSVWVRGCLKWLRSIGSRFA